MDWVMFPKNSYIEALTPTVAVFGNRAYKKVIKIKWGLEIKAQIQYDRLSL